MGHADRLQVYENPKNLNFSRSFMYTLGTPYTHTGVLATYPFARWFGLSLGFTMGWDTSDNPGRTSRASSWSGVSAYAAYDWTSRLRTALRAEYFADPQGVRSSESIAPGNNVELWEITATLQSNIWRGLFGRLEYRHDEANRRAFTLGNHGTTPTSHAQDTLSLALSYSFF